MSTTSGGATIWYTTNGEDPRLLGGAVNTGSATAFSGNVVINGNTTIKARTRVGTTWSALTEATFVVSPEDGGIVISEINYHPYDVTTAEAAAVPGVVEDEFEFIEIHNTHPTKSINLMNMSLTGGVSFTFGNVSLGAGQRALVVENMAAFAARYGTGHTILGEWSGGLNNSGDTVELRNALGGLMMAVTYTDAAPWSQAADGDGPTLELFDPAGSTSEASSWRASFYAGGSPGGERQSSSRRLQSRSRGRRGRSRCVAGQLWPVGRSRSRCRRQWRWCRRRGRLRGVAKQLGSDIARQRGRVATDGVGRARD